MKHFYIYKRHLSLIVLLFIFKAASAQNVGITDKTDVTVPDASAGLDIDFSNKGLLIPRVALSAINVASPITSPTVSLLVYNTATSPNSVPAATAVSPGYYYYSGTAWIRLATGTTGWEIKGNSGTSESTNFLGTIDEKDLIIKTTNTERARFEKTTGDFNLGLAAGGVAKSTKYLYLKSIDGRYGNSTLALQNEDGFNGALLHTSGINALSPSLPAPNLTDLVFKTVTGSQSNLRLEARSTPTEHFVLGNTNPEWQFGSSANPTLVISAVATNPTLSSAPTGGNSALRFGNFGIGISATSSPWLSDPTASLHIIRAGTATASTAPMKFTSGVDLTAPEAGAFEYGTSTVPRLAFTPTSGVGNRKRVALTNDVTPAIGALPIGNGTDFTTSKLTQGKGITIDDTTIPGKITITNANPTYFDVPVFSKADSSIISISSASGNTGPYSLASSTAAINGTGAVIDMTITPGLEGNYVIYFNTSISSQQKTTIAIFKNGAIQFESIRRGSGFKVEDPFPISTMVYLTLTNTDSVSARWKTTQPGVNQPNTAYMYERTLVVQRVK